MSLANKVISQFGHIWPVPMVP